MKSRVNYSLIKWSGVKAELPFHCSLQAQKNVLRQVKITGEVCLASRLFPEQCATGLKSELLFLRLSLEV